MFVCYNAHDGVYLYNDGDTNWKTTPHIQNATKKTTPTVFYNVVKHQFSSDKNNWKVIDMETKSIKDLDENYSSNGEVSYVETIQNGELIKIVDALQTLKSVMNPSALNRLVNRESELDKQLSDIYHHIEVSNANAFQAWQFYKELRTVLIERRDVKDSVAIYNKLITSSKPFYETANDVINYMSTRDWSRRCFEKKEDVE